MVSNDRNSPSMRKTHWPVLTLRFSQRRALRRREFFDFRQMAYAGHAYVDDLDGILGKGVTIFALMGLMKARKNIIELRFCDDAVRKRDLEFVTLADIAQIAATHERHACRFEPIVGELFSELRLHRGDIGVKTIKIDVAADLELGTSGVVFQIRGEKAHGRRDAGVRRHDDFPESQHGGDFHAVQRSGSAESHQREIAGIDALLHCARANGVGHVAVDDGEHAFGGFELGHAERVGEPFHDTMGGCFIKRHAAAKKIVLVEPAEDQIGVGYGRFLAAAAISCRTRNGAGAARPDPKGAALIDVGDRAAASTDCMNIDHRHQQRKSCDRSAARIGLGKAAFDHDADIGAGAADVESDKLAAAAQSADPGAAENAGGETRQQRHYGFVADHRRRGDPAVRRHHAKLGAQPALTQSALQTTDITAHLRADEGAEAGRREPLKLTELRRD